MTAEAICEASMKAFLNLAVQCCTNKNEPARQFRGTNRQGKISIPAKAERPN